MWQDTYQLVRHMVEAINISWWWSRICQLRSRDHMTDCSQLDSTSELMWHVEVIVWYESKHESWEMNSSATSIDQSRNLLKNVSIFQVLMTSWIMMHETKVNSTSWKFMKLPEKTRINMILILQCSLISRYRTYPTIWWNHQLVSH